MVPPNSDFSSPRVSRLTREKLREKMEAEEPLASASSSPTPTNSETLVSETEEERGDSNSKPTSFDQEDILRAIEVVERDSVAIAQSFSSLFDSLRLALSEVTGRSVEHMHCFSDAAGRVQECALDAATKGNRYINSCLRLNEEMKGIDSLAAKLKILRRNVDTLDSAANRLLRIP